MEIKRIKLTKDDSEGVGLRLPKELKARIKREAACLGISTNQLVNNAIVNWLDQSEPRKEKVR